MTKKISFGTKPSSKVMPENPDAWVESRTTDEPEPMKRLTIDLPASLHKAIKTQCAMRGKKIADELRALLSQKYQNNIQRNTENIK